MKINPLTATAIGLAVGSVATVMLSGKKISGKKIAKEMKEITTNLSSMMPGMSRNRR